MPGCRGTAHFHIVIRQFNNKKGTNNNHAYRRIWRNRVYCVYAFHVSCFPGLARLFGERRQQLRAVFGMYWIAVADYRHASNCFGMLRRVLFTERQ